MSKVSSYLCIHVLQLPMSLVEKAVSLTSHLAGYFFEKNKKVLDR